MRKIILTIALFLPAMAYGQTCTTATCNAAGVSEAQVLAALPAPGNTNPTVTVNIPSGSIAWTTGFAYTIPPAVTSLIIQGNTTVSCSGTAGTSSYACTATDNTVFIDSYVASNTPLMNIHVGASALRMTGLTFQGGNLASGVTKPNGFLTFDGTSTNFRIDHSHFNTNTYVPVNSGGGITILTNLYGVVDHTVFDLFAQNNGVRVYNSDNGDFNWSQPTQFGTSQFVYLENDVFNGGAANDCDDGGRIVIRYSTINAASSGGDQGLWQTHQMGQGTQRSRGCRAEEVYHLYAQNPNPSNNLYTVGDGGSGTGLAWNNTISSGYQYDIGFQSIRELATGHSQTAPPNGIGYCGNGSSGAVSAWDGNTSSVTGYPCIDQTGRGKGDLISGNFPNMLNTTTGTITWPHNLREPWYVWNETIASGHVYINPVWNGVQMFPDQSFYVPAASFNGTTGTGFGLRSARPSTCTAGPGGPFDTSPTGSYGVSYFATDDNSGNGELYVCTSTNTWTAIYQPYTYPHPLTGGTPQAATPTASPVAGTYATTQTVTLSDTTPSSTITYCTDTTNTCTPSTTYTTTISIPSTHYIRAFANASGFTQSTTASFLYTISTPQAATPVISPAAGTYPRTQTASISCSSPSPTIHYTTNGTTPTGSSTLYTGSFTVSTSQNVQAICDSSGLTTSAVGQSTISITSAITIEGGGTAHCAVPTSSCQVGTAFAGDTILVDGSDGANTLTAPTDGTNTYHLINQFQDTANAFTAYQWAACNVPAGTYTVTLNGAGSGDPTNIHAKILANTSTSPTCWDTGPVTQGQVNLTGSSTLTSGSPQLPSGNNEWVEGYGIPNITTTPTVCTAGANYTLFDALTSGTSHQAACPIFWNQGTATATNAPITTSTTFDWVDVSTAILPVGGATPVCGQPIQTGPNFSGTYNVPPFTLPLNIGFTNPDSACTMHFTSAAGNMTTAATCASPTYSGSSSISSTTTYSVINCGTGRTSSANVGGTWTIVLVTFTLSTATAGTGSGTITCTPSGSGISAGTPYSCTVSPAAASSITSVSGCGGSGTTTYSGPMPASNCTITATFQGTAAAPTFSPTPGGYATTQTVTFSDATSGATICYTIDGTTPTANAGTCTHGTTYSTAITVAASTTIKAIGSKTAWTDSGVSTGIYTINGTVATPTFLPVAGSYGPTQNVTIITTAGSTICYTVDGSTPTADGAGTCTHGTTYSGPVSVATSLTLKAVGSQSGFLDSSVGSAAYVINGSAATPTFSPVAGTYATTQTVTISSATGGVTICYTTDGSTPTSSPAGTCGHGTTYSTPVSVSTSLTLKAIATEAGFSDSTVGSAAYVINGAVGTPTFSPVAGTYTFTQTVTIMTSTAGATLCYTIDGSTPTANGSGTCTHGTTYSGPVTVASSLTLKAVGSKSGFTDSSVGSAAYVIDTPTTTITISGNCKITNGKAQ